MDDRYYLAVGSDQKGPYTFSQLQTMWRSGSITADTHYWQQGFDAWVPISSLAEMLDPQPTRSSPPVSPALHPALVQQESDKRILPAFLLCFFFGIFGAHAFYAGRSKQGLLYLAFLFGISFFAGPIMFWAGFGDLGVALPPPVAAIISVGLFAVGDFIRILVGAYKDGQGRKISKWT